MQLLNKKRVVITGGSMGIGLAVAKKCAFHGASIILISRHEEELQKALSELDGKSGTHKYKKCDVSDIAQVKKLSKELENEFGYIDALVNCAGIYGPIGKIDEIDPEEFAQTININLIGTFNMCHYLIPLLKKAERGKIVNYSGGGASGPFLNYSAYATSKTGVVKLTENIAHELIEDGIDVNSIAPGFIITRLHQQTIEAGSKAGSKFLEKTKEQIKQGGVSPEIPTELTVFLLSSRSDGLTGKFISAQWDPWEEDSFIDMLKNDDGLATLRRIDNKFFSKKN